MNIKLNEQLALAFVSQPLPDSVAVDPCASYRGYANRKGTNLLSVVEAETMFTGMLEKLANLYTDEELVDMAEESRHEMASTWDFQNLTLNEIYEAGYIRGLRDALGVEA